MDGKLLVLCDEKPGTHNDGHKDYIIRDSRFLIKPMIDPDDDPDRIFVSWDSIIPEDRAFIEACKYYARFTEKPEDPKFVLSRRGSTDPSSGTIKDSVEEECYYSVYRHNLEYLSSLMKKGNEWTGEAMELVVQYQMDVNEKFFNDLTDIINKNSIVTVLPCFEKGSENTNISRYREALLRAWKDRNELRRKSGFRRPEEYSAATVLEPETYSDFGEILYKRSADEIMKIYSMPYFFEDDDKADR